MSSEGLSEEKYTDNDDSNEKQCKEEPEAAINSDRQIIVKFYLESTNKLLFTNSYSPNYLVASIKKDIERFFNTPFVNITLKVVDRVLENEDKIGDCGSDNFGVLEVALVFANVHLKLEPEDIAHIYEHVPSVLPDVLTVQVPTEDKGVYNVVVEVENKCIYKPNLGGYENTFTGVEYHNAYSQTGPYLNKKPGFSSNHTDTQTVDSKNKKIDVGITKSTQINSVFLWIPEVSDKVLSPRPYETAEERLKRLDVHGKVIFIQRCCRSWIMRKRVKELSREYNRRIRLQKEKEMQEELENENRIKRDLVNKAFPVNPEDFQMLYSMIERWKKAEIHRIVTEYCGPAKIVQFQVLLDKEIELLHSIDKVRQKITEDIETQKIVSFFKTIGMPLRWHSDYNNVSIEMDTLETQKGREYFQMYKSVCDTNLDKDQKLELYTNLKQYFSSHKCPTVLELNKLIDRMCTMLARGMSKVHYITLEKIIQKLLFHHYQQPDCNEGVTARMNRLKEQTMKNKLICCRSCQKLKCIDSFVLNARMNKTNICKSCQWLNRSEDPLVDLTPYKYILKQIRKFELEHHGNTSVAFIVTVNDVYHIVDNIWRGKSVLSECNDVYQLRLVRWNVNELWSPWNCIPLTNEEAKSHIRVKNLREVYDEHFLNTIYNKHALINIQFKHLIFVENCLEERNRDTEDKSIQ